MITSRIIRRAVPWAAALAGAVLLWRVAGRSSDDARVAPDVTAEALELPAVELPVIPAEHLISRPGEYTPPPRAEPESGSTPAADAAPVAPPARPPVLATPPAPPPAAARVMYRYVSVENMLSLSETGAVALLKQSKPSLDDGSGVSSGEVSRLSDMVALAYVSRARMLSDEANAWTPPTRRAKKHGFLSEDIITESAAVDDAETAQPEDPDAYARALFLVREAETFMDAGRLADAADRYARALALFPEMTYANHQLGRISLQRGEYGKAIGFFTAALDADEMLGETLNDLGIAYLYDGRLNEAMKSFEASLRAEPDYLEPMFNAGLVLRRRNQIDEAREQYTKYLKARPGEARAYRELGMLDLMQTNLNSAVAHLERAILLDDTWYIPYLDAASVLAELGEFERAIDLLDRSLAYAPPMQVFQLYRSPVFTEYRLTPESQPFQARLVDRLRKGMR